MAHFYYRILGQEFGPISLESLQDKIATGELTVSDGFRCGNGMNWTSIADFHSQDFIQGTAPSGTVTAQAILTWDGGHDDVPAPNDHLPAKSPKWWPHTPSRLESLPYTFDEFRVPTLSSALLADDKLPLGGGDQWMPADSLEVKFEDKLHPPTAGSNPPMTLADAAAEDIHHTPAASTKETMLDDVGAVESSPRWYVRMGHIDRGPMEFEKLLELAATGYILPTDRVREGADSDWNVARSIAGLFSAGYGSIPDALPAVLARTARTSFVPPAMPARPVPVQPIARSPVTSVLSPQPAYYRPQQSVSSPQAASIEAAVPGTVIGSSNRGANARQQFVEFQSKSNPPKSIERQPDSKPSVGRPQQPDIESKHKRRRGHYQEPTLVGNRNLKLAALIGLVAFLLFLVFSPKSATLLDFGLPNHELNFLYNSLNSKWAENPTMDLWSATKKNYVYRLESIILKIKKIPFRHQVRDNLIAAAESMIEAAKSDSSDVVTSRLKKARELLDQSSRDLVGSTKPQIKSAREN